MARYFVSLDMHWKHATVCILDGDGKRDKRLTIRGAFLTHVSAPTLLESRASVDHQSLPQLAAKDECAHLNGHYPLQRQSF